MVPRDFNAFRTSCRCPNVLIGASIIFSHDHLALDSHAKYIFEQGQLAAGRKLVDRQEDRCQTSAYVDRIAPAAQDPCLLARSPPQTTRPRPVGKASLEAAGCAHRFRQKFKRCHGAPDAVLHWRDRKIGTFRRPPDRRSIGRFNF
jgi:hypothetical protein